MADEIPDLSGIELPRWFEDLLDGFAAEQPSNPDDLNEWALAQLADFESLQAAPSQEEVAQEQPALPQAPIQPPAQSTTAQQAPSTIPQPTQPGPSNIPMMQLTPKPAPKPPKNNQRLFQEIKAPTRRPYPKFNAHNILYHYGIRIGDSHKIKDFLPELAQMFQDVIEKTQAEHQPEDKMRIAIHHKNSPYAASTRMSLVGETTTEEIMSVVEKVLNSNENFSLDTNFCVDIAVFERKAAGKRRIPLIGHKIDAQRKRSCVTIENQDDQLCMARAIVIGIASTRKDKSYPTMRRKQSGPTAMKAIRDLHQQAGVPLGPCANDEAQKFADATGYQIKIVDRRKDDIMLNEVTFVTQPVRDQIIYLWRTENPDKTHHCDLIKNIRGFLGYEFYCTKCDKGYWNAVDHHCTAHCRFCDRNDCIRQDPGLFCNKCNYICQNAKCLEIHAKKCKTHWFCWTCHKRYPRKQITEKDHKCGEQKCPGCKKYVVPEGHECFISRKKAAKIENKSIYFDAETDQSSGTHKINFIVASKDKDTKMVFKGYNAMNDFGRWLFANEHHGYTVIAHFGKGFDFQFVLGWMIQHSANPKNIKAITVGNKLTMLCHNKLKIKLVDSYSFMPHPLRALPKMLDIEETKGDFPHLFNREENFGKVFPQHPPPEDYGYDEKSPAEKVKFMDWYDTVKDLPFDFDMELEKYCTQDVTILKKVCEAFREHFLSVGSIDPFSHPTIAGACWDLYCTDHIPGRQIAMLPVQGYNQGKWSKISIAWLDWTAQQEGIEISHAVNTATGEKKVGQYYVDGYCEETNTIYEFDGCLWHGCECQKADERVHSVRGVKPIVLRRRTEERHKFLRDNCTTLVVMKECEFARQRKEDPELAEFIKNHKVQPRLNPRHALYGGRTNGIKLYHKCTGTEKIHYVDFTSLYPTVQHQEAFPVGHPEILCNPPVENFGELFGIAHVTMTPPTDLYHPVLPYRTNGKLYFPLCRSCAETNSTQCDHSDRERSITGTYITPEIKKAIEKGYKLEKIHEAYHYKRKSTKLFKSYVEKFLKLKHEASGFPDYVTTEQDKAEYIEKIWHNDHILLDMDKIAKNNGMRTVTKLCLNSLWGRFAMNEVRRHLKYIGDNKEFQKMMTDVSIEIDQVYFINENVLYVGYKDKAEHMKQTDRTNVIIASFVPGYGRMRLYEELDKAGENVLYFDTDSIIYKSPDGSHLLPLGEGLGKLTSELATDDHIDTFITTGPKSYIYTTAKGKQVVKLKGFATNKFTRELITPDTVHEILQLKRDLGEDKTITIPYPSKFTIDKKTREIRNQDQEKTFRVTYEKRIVLKDLSTVPYGYRANREQWAADIVWPTIREPRPWRVPRPPRAPRPERVQRHRRAPRRVQSDSDIDSPPQSPQPGPSRKRSAGTRGEPLRKNRREEDEGEAVGFDDEEWSSDEEMNSDDERFLDNEEHDVGEYANPYLLTTTRPLQRRPIHQVFNDSEKSDDSDSANSSDEDFIEDAPKKKKKKRKIDSDSEEDQPRKCRKIDSDSE